MSPVMVPAAAVIDDALWLTATAAALAARHAGESAAVLRALASVEANRRRAGFRPRVAPIADGGPVDKKLAAYCRRILARARAGSLVDRTGGAVLVHRRFNFPAWARQRAPSASVGDYVFYTLEGDA